MPDTEANDTSIGTISDRDLLQVRLQALEYAFRQHRVSDTNARTDDDTYVKISQTARAFERYLTKGLTVVASPRD